MARQEIESIRLSLTTNGDGAGSVRSDKYVLGRLLAVRWFDGNLADGVDGQLVAGDSNDGSEDTIIATLANANDDGWYYPRTAVHADTDGAVITGLYTEPIFDGWPELHVVDGGDSKKATVIMYYTPVA
jgi:hypothetical protein